MSANRRENALIALQKAMLVRKHLGHSLWRPVSPFDSAENLGIEVRFTDIGSLEGMYVKGVQPIILLSSLRPQTRMTYTCAHEIGHHAFDHGTHVDEYQDEYRVSERSEEEFLAQAFAGFFLMPKSAIERAFSVRGWNIQSATPLEIYTIANLFGVGYKTLIDHLEFGLRLLKRPSAEILKQTSLREIKYSILGQETTGQLIVVDDQWTGRAIDVHVNDLMLLPSGTIHEDDKAQFVSELNNKVLFEACRPGIGRFYNPQKDWAVNLRVSRREYIGRSVFRHLEDPEYGSQPPDNH